MTDEEKAAQVTAKLHGTHRVLLDEPLYAERGSDFTSIVPVMFASGEQRLLTRTFKIDRDGYVVGSIVSYDGKHIESLLWE